MFISIATYINEDLAARLQAGQELPVALTINALARHYDVSFTPVRTAVEQLTLQGLLIKSPNGRLARATPGKNGAAVKPGKTSLPTRARDSYALISSDLIDLSLKGEAVYLREEATAEKYSLSRSAVRNIFHRLAGTGILDHIPRRGWRLRVFCQEDLDAFSDAREALELKALELAIPQLVEKDLQQMLDHNRMPSNPQDEPMIDNSLHVYFIDKADNFYIRDFFERHGSYFSMIFKKEAKDRDAALETAHDHRKILTALLNQEWQAARKALSRHIRFNHPVLNKI